MTDYSEFGQAELNGWSDPGTAKAYADGFASAAEECVPALVKAVAAGPDCDALDLCCGHGIVTQGLLEAGSRVTGLDFSPAMLELARARSPDAEFMEGDATALPFEDKCFDAVTMGFGMLHIPDPDRALSEARRVLRPGGRFAYSVWHGPETSTAFRTVFDAIGKYGDPSIALPPGPPIHAFADPEIAFPALEAAGFAHPLLETVHCSWKVQDPGEPFDLFIEGTVRGALLLRSQPPENKTAIRSAVSEAIRLEFGNDGPWRVPIPAAIVSASA